MEMFTEKRITKDRAKKKKKAGVGVKKGGQ